MIKLLIDNKRIKTKFFTFPDGTRHVKIEDLEIYGNESMLVLAQVSNSDDIMDILLLKDAIDRGYPKCPSFLYIPYMLGSRQDRVMVEGEPLSVQVYANMINSANFDQVLVLDPHSVATVASLKKGVAKGLKELYYDGIIIKNSEDAIVVSPDAGAVKRATEFAKVKGINKLVKADKTRDLATGKITAFELYANPEDIFDKHVYIVDDIVTNGGTFLGLLKELQYHQPRSINLVVTHADHYDGLLSMSAEFDQVYVTNSKDDYEYRPIKNVAVIDVFDRGME